MNYLELYDLTFIMYDTQPEEFPARSELLQHCSYFVAARSRFDSVQWRSAADHMAVAEQVEIHAVGISRHRSAMPVLDGPVVIELFIHDM